MSDKVFLDTNVLVYAFGGKKSSTPDSRVDVARQIVAEGGVVSVQVLNEFVQVCCRKAGLSWDQVDSSLQAIKKICSTVVPLTLETHEGAVEISGRYGFQIYDSLILASAQQAECSVIYTEDLQHGQQIETLKIVNPFLET
jgi:predicted nucleic acid-binding protein